MLTEKFFVIAEIGHDLTLWILLILSVISITFIFERFLSLRVVKNRSLRMSKDIRDVLQSSNLPEIEELGKDRDSLEGRAITYGLRHMKKNGNDGLEEVFNTFQLTEKPQLEKHLNFLATVGSNAPFIGLLGTVFGIMDAFRGLATSQGDASAVMIGISKALVATAVGLLVAIPAVIAYNYFQRQVKSVLQSLESAKELCLAYAKSTKG